MVGSIKPSAYSKVAWNIFIRIADVHQVAHTPMLRANRIGVFYAPPKGPLIYPSGETEFAEDVILKNCYHFNADMLLTVKDIPGVFEQLPEMSVEWVPYTPIQSSPVSPGIPARLRTAFKIVAMSKFGQEELRKNGIKSTVIPHGFDPEIYHSVEDRVACRRKFVHMRPEHFIIGYVGRNQGRKHIDMVLLALRRLLDLNPDLKKTVRLFLWTNIDKDIPLRPLILEQGLNEYVIWPNEAMYNQGLSEELMNDLYNSFDCLIGAGNEGFWLPGLECQAAGHPVLHVDYAAPPEFIGSGYTIKVDRWEYNNPQGEKQPLMDLDDACRKIMRVYNGDPERFTRRALRFVKPFAWDNIVDSMWKPFLENCEVELCPLITKEGITKWDVQRE